MFVAFRRHRIDPPFLVAALALAYVGALALLDWLMVAPPRGFPGFLIDGATADKVNRLGLYAGLIGRPSFSLTTDQYAWAVRCVLLALFGLHALAVVAVRRWPRPRAVWFGLPVVAQAVALGYPPLGADVFYYAFSGHLLADFGLSPYRFPPASFPADPLFRFNFWTGITSPYGPLWTTMSSAVVGAVGTDPLRVVLAFNAVAALTALGCAVVT